jgi:hypothetical protein
MWTDLVGVHLNCGVFYRVESRCCAQQAQTCMRPGSARVHFWQNRGFHAKSSPASRKSGIAGGNKWSLISTNLANLVKKYSARGQVWRFSHKPEAPARE